MRDNQGGSITNTASAAALMPGPAQAIYSITKAAIVNMTKAFAKECAIYNIRVNALLPGLTKTKFAEALFTNQQIYEGAIKTNFYGTTRQTRGDGWHRFVPCLSSF